MAGMNDPLRPGWYGVLVFKQPYVSPAYPSFSEIEPDGRRVWDVAWWNGTGWDYRPHNHLGPSEALPWTVEAWKLVRLSPPQPAITRETTRMPSHEETFATLAAALLLAADNRAADPADCEHCFRVGVNSQQALCLVCRTTIDGPCCFGLYAQAPPGGRHLWETAVLASETPSG